MRDVAKLWSAGYALGATFENTLVVSDNRVLNAEGLRFADEFVRHKALDAIGDLALAGAPLLGAYRSIRGGHKLNHAVLCALMADPSAWTYVDGGQVARRTAAKPMSRPAWWRRCSGRRVLTPQATDEVHIRKPCATFPADCGLIRLVLLRFLGGSRLGLGRYGGLRRPGLQGF